MQIVIATGNMYKFRELKWMLKELLKGFDIDLVSLKNFPHYVAPEETKTTFEENALVKAEHAAKTLGVPAIGDDSGLIVYALNKEPGIFSARYAGPNATDQENRNKLKAKLETLREEQRCGDFVCALAFATTDKPSKVVSAFCDGNLLTTECGGSGFGYEPLFIKSGYGKTFAQLDEDTKNRISHRRKAFDKLAPCILKYVEDACITL